MAPTAETVEKTRKWLRRTCRLPPLHREPSRLIANEIAKEIEQLFEIPPCAMIIPETMNMGTASRVKTVEPGKHGPGHVTDAKGKMAVQQIGSR